MKKIMVTDITLKVIEQLDMPLTFREKLSIAEKLNSAKVDAIELPICLGSKENEVMCRTFAQSINNAIVKIPVGDKIDSVGLAYECIKNAKKPCLQVVMPLSTTQMEYFYHVKAPQMLEKIAQLVKESKTFTDSVEFVALDAFRASKDFLNECISVAIENGANSITICDDTMEALPSDFAEIVGEIKSKFNVKLSVLTSDNLSLAVANVIESINAGADGVVTSSVGKYVSISTLANLVRAKKYNLDLDCNLDVTNATTISNQVSEGCEGEKEQKVEGKTPTVIESTATLKNTIDVIKKLGYELSDQDYGKVYEEFKKVASKKEAIDIKEFEAIVASNAMQVSSTYHLVSFVVNSSNIVPATANVTLERDGERLTGVSSGDGPIDAAFHAIEQIIGHHYELDDFQVHAVTKGRGAVGSSIIRLRANGKLYPGNGVSTDIIGACIRAYINAINKIVYEEK